MSALSSDRRKYTRLDLSIKIHYRILESLGKHGITETKDISEKGICIPLAYIKQVDQERLYRFALL